MMANYRRRDVGHVKYGPGDLLTRGSTTVAAATDVLEHPSDYQDLLPDGVAKVSVHDVKAGSVLPVMTALGLMANVSIPMPRQRTLPVVAFVEAVCATFSPPGAFLPLSYNDATGKTRARTPAERRDQPYIDTMKPALLNLLPSGSTANKDLLDKLKLDYNFGMPLTTTRSPARAKRGSSSPSDGAAGGGRGGAGRGAREGPTGLSDGVQDLLEKYGAHARADDFVRGVGAAQEVTTALLGSVETPMAKLAKTVCPGFYPTKKHYRSVRRQVLHAGFTNALLLSATMHRKMLCDSLLQLGTAASMHSTDSMRCIGHLLAGLTGTGKTFYTKNMASWLGDVVPSTAFLLPDIGEDGKVDIREAKPLILTARDIQALLVEDRNTKVQGRRSAHDATLNTLKNQLAELQQQHDSIGVLSQARPQAHGIYISAVIVIDEWQSMTPQVRPSLSPLVRSCIANGFFMPTPRADRVGT
jgi:hypothetical protein